MLALSVLYMIYGSAISIYLYGRKTNIKEEEQFNTLPNVSISSNSGEYSYDEELWNILAYLVIMTQIIT